MKDGLDFFRSQPEPGGFPCSTTKNSTPSTSWNSSAFDPLSKRRRGYPSETNVQRGLRVVHGAKELIEKLGKEDPCPCGSGRRFRRLLPQLRPF
jgi:hypothetical protein